MAPPSTAGSTPADCPIVAHITPMVAAVPNDVPIRKETTLQLIRAMSTNVAGVKKPAARETRAEMVPLARYRPVSMPMKMISAPFAVLSHSASSWLLGLLRAPSTPRKRRRSPAQ